MSFSFEKNCKNTLATLQPTSTNLLSMVWFKDLPKFQTILDLKSANI